MRNHNHRPRRHYRSRNNGRGFKRDGSSGVDFIRNSVSPDSNSRRIFRGNQNASKLLEKYLNLGKEALSSGDKILSENYFQHADHFVRMIENKNINQNQNRIQADYKPTEEDKHLVKNSNVDQNKTIEKKAETSYRKAS